MPDNEGRTALMWAAQRGNYKVLEVMLQKEVDVHAFDNLGGTGTKFCVLGQSAEISNIRTHTYNVCISKNSHLKVCLTCAVSDLILVFLSCM